MTPRARLELLRLLRGARWSGWEALRDATEAQVDRAIDDAVSELSVAKCAVTAGDFERLAAARPARRWARSGRTVRLGLVGAAVFGVTGAVLMTLSARGAADRVHWDWPHVATHIARPDSGVVHHCPCPRRSVPVQAQGRPPSRHLPDRITTRAAAPSRR